MTNDINRATKEEYLLKGFIIETGTQFKYFDIREANSSKEFYKFHAQIIKQKG